MQVVHWPDKNRDKTTVTACGLTIPKVPDLPWSTMPKQDTSKVNSTLDKVNCVECLRLRVKHLNKLIDKTIDRIEVCQSNSTK